MLDLKYLLHTVRRGNISLITEMLNHNPYFIDQENHVFFNMFFLDSTPEWGVYIYIYHKIFSLESYSQDILIKGDNLNRSLDSCNLNVLSTIRLVQV